MNKQQIRESESAVERAEETREPKSSAPQKLHNRPKHNDIEKALTAKAEGGLGGHGRGRSGVGDLTRNLLPVVHPRDLQEGSNPSHAIFALIFYRRHFLSRLVQPVCDGDGAALSGEAEGEDVCM